MKLRIFSSILLVSLGFGQDCQFSATLSSASSSTSFQNTPSRGCTTWALTYISNGFSALTLTFQSAPDSSGTPGSWVTFPGTAVAGANPLTAVTSGSFIGLGYQPWLRVTLSGLTGSGSVSVTVFGWRVPPAEITGASGIAAQVEGRAAAGAAPVGNPVWIGGTDGSLVRAMLLDASGRPIVVGAAASGAALAGNPVLVSGSDGSVVRTLGMSTQGGGAATPLAVGIAAAAQDGLSNLVVFPAPLGSNAGRPLAILPFTFGGDGTTINRSFSCTNQAPITVSAATDVVIVTGVMSTNVRICHISVASDAAANVIIRQGTGTTCGTNTASLTGAYQNATSMALDFSSNAPLRTTVAARDVCLNFSAAVTAGGVVIYAQY